MGAFFKGSSRVHRSARDDLIIITWPFQVHFLQCQAPLTSPSLCSPPPPFFFPPSTQSLFRGSIGIIIPLSDFFKDTRFVPSASGLRWFNIKTLALYDVKVCLRNSKFLCFFFPALWAISWCKEFLGVNVGVCLMLRGCGDTGEGTLCALRCARVLCCFSRVWLFATLWTVARQAPLSMGFSRQEYWSGLPCPPPRDLPNPGIKPASLTSPVLAGRFFTTSTTWEVHTSRYDSCKPFSFSSLPLYLIVMIIPALKEKST